MMLAVALSVRNAIGTWIRKTSAGCGRKHESVQSLGRAREHGHLKINAVHCHSYQYKREMIFFPPLHLHILFEGC